MIHYMFLLGYILVTCHKNNIVTSHVTFMLYRRNKTCLLGRDKFVIAEAVLNIIVQATAFGRILVST